MNLEAYIDSTAALLGLPLAPEHRPGVVRYLQLVAAQAPRVTEFAATLTAADESGNTFTPVATAGDEERPWLRQAQPERLSGEFESETV